MYVLDNYDRFERHETEIERQKRIEEREEAGWLKADMEEDEYEQY